VLRVTFDTNALDLACRPERSPGNPLQPRLPRVNEALRAGVLQGFYSISMLTIEGVPRIDRAKTYSTTQMTSTKAADADAIRVTYTVEQPDRPPLPQPVKERITAAHALGLRALKAVPRLGMYHYLDPAGEYFLPNGADGELSRWIDKAHDITRAIEARGVGMAQLQAIAARLGHGKPDRPWFKWLSDATDIHQQREIERAFAEWADGDTIAAHYAYGIDVFCSNDAGKSNAKPSILDPTNKQWLEVMYGVRMMTFEELLDEVDRIWPRA
jgi:hypothetical protein